MKYRVQMEVVLDNADSNTLLAHIESIKGDVFAPTGYTAVPIVREAKKVENAEITQEEYDAVDFDAGAETHTHEQTGLDEFKVRVDVSFAVEQDYHDLLNYMETFKANISSGFCRFFICNHDEVPLKKDSGYSYINLAGPELTYPIVIE